MSNRSKKARLSVDVSPELRRRIRVIASARDLTIRDYVVEALREKLERERADEESFLAFSSTTDPVLAELWDNEKDAAYDEL